MACSTHSAASPAAARGRPVKASVLRALVRGGGLRARLALARDLKGFLRLQYLGTASELGLLEALVSPRSAGDLQEQLGIVDTVVFTTFLQLGCSLGALSRRGDRYSLKSSGAREMGASPNGSLSAAAVELVDYHGECYRHLAGHLRTGERGDYLAGRTELVARSSRIVEPVLADYVHRSVASAGAEPTVLEVGCGSGVYLLHTAGASPRASGFGIELEPDVAGSARALLARNSLDRRFSVLCGRGLEPLPDEEARFDVVTLYNNAYYFAREERRRLFAEIRGRLSPNGRLHIASMLHGPTPASLNLSLVLAVTRGSQRLPTQAELEVDLAAAGFSAIAHERLIPTEPFVALAAR
jgi:SAM-dependent methyltransferase